MTPTRLSGTECRHQWVVTSPAIQANGLVVFTDTRGQLSLLPETDLSEPGRRYLRGRGAGHGQDFRRPAHSPAERRR